MSGPKRRSNATSRHAVHRIGKLEDQLGDFSAASARSETLLNDMVLPFVRTTPGKLEELHLGLQRLGASVERLAESVQTIGVQLGQRVDNMEPRVRRVEERFVEHDAADRRERALIQRRNRTLAAIWAVVSAIGGAIGGWLTGRH